MEELEPWHPHPHERVEARLWAQRLLASNDWVILDTETTGLDSDAEAVQISIVCPQGRVLLSTLLRPSRPIPAEATAIHGITDAMVAGAISFRSIRRALAELLAERLIISYNAAFDERILWQTAHNHLADGLKGLQWDCAMERYAAFVGDWNYYYGRYCWQRLPRGPEHQDHEAAGDCLATLALIRRMAGVPEPAGREA